MLEKNPPCRRGEIRRVDLPEGEGLAKVLLLRLWPLRGELGSQVSACQKHQTRKERPEHQRYGDREWTVDFVEVEPGECLHVSVFGNFPENSHSHCGQQHASGAYLPVGKKPINEKKDQDAGERGEYSECHCGQGFENDILAQPEHYEIHNGLIARRSAYRG